MNRWRYAAVAAFAIAGTAAVLPAAQATPPIWHGATARPSIVGGGGTTFPLVAFVPEATGATAEVTTFGQDQTPTVQTITYPGEQFGSAIAPDGSSALLATVDDINVITSFDSNPVSQKLIDVSQFGDEGGNGLDGAATSVAMNADTAVAAVAGQGIVQLRKSGDSWAIDHRVDIASSKKDHTHKERGFIPVPRGNEKHTIRFDAVALSPVRTPKGHYIAIAVARKSDLIQVIGKIGTAHPDILGRISDPALGVLGGSTTDQFGDGEVEFSPATATRAIIGTTSGAAILDLDDTSHPKLLPAKGTPLPADEQPTDLAVGPDGDTVTVASGNGTATYTGLLTGHQLKFESVSERVGGGAMQGLAYLADGDLAIQRFDVVNNEDRPYLDLYSNSGDLISEAQLTTVGNPRALSAGPGIFPAAFNNKTQLDVMAGKVKIPLFLEDGIGTYKLSVFSGQLPSGLRLNTDSITGHTKDTGNHSVMIRALNQYGGTAFLHLHLHVRH